MPRPHPGLIGVCAVGGLLAGVLPATCAMTDDAGSLLMAYETGSGVFSLASAPDPLVGYARAGWRASLSTLAHNVRGTVTIVDADTFRVDNFFYDGGGINVHFILAAADAYTAFRDARLVTDLNLLGTARNGDSLTIDLPTGTTFDGYNAISVWCLPAQANFGSGAFAAPEPVGASLLALGALTLVGWTRRRPKPSKHLFPAPSAAPLRPEAPSHS